MLADLIQSSGTDVHFSLEIITCDPRYIQWTIPCLLYKTNQKEEFISMQNLNKMGWSIMSFFYGLNHVY